MVTLTVGMHEGGFIGELAMGIGYHGDAQMARLCPCGAAHPVDAAHHRGANL